MTEEEERETEIELELALATLRDMRRNLSSSRRSDDYMWVVSMRSSIYAAEAEVRRLSALVEPRRVRE